MTRNATPAQVATRQGMTTVLWRECRECGQSKPETREHWREWSKNAQNNRPRTRVCWPCDNERKRNYYHANSEFIAERARKYRHKHPEKSAEQKRKYYQENKEKVAEGARRWRRENAEKKLQADRKWRQVNAETIKERHRKWEKENRETVLERSRKYCQENPEKRRVVTKKHDAKRRRAKRRIGYEALPLDERGLVLKQILAEHRWRALLDAMPHVVYLQVWPDNVQYAGITREERFELRMNEHRTGHGGIGNPDVYAAFAQCEPRIQIIHHCENRDDALALEAQEIAGRCAAGITMFNIQHVVKENA